MVKRVPRWQVILTRRPEKTLAKLPADVRGRVDEKLLSLESDPRPKGCKYLKSVKLYRLRVGDWRIMYSIEDEELVVLVIRIAPRGEVYKGL